MKKIFAFAMAIVSMAAVMTSCSTDNADFIEQKAPAPTAVSISTTTTSFDESKALPEFDGNIYFGAFEHQNEYISSIYTVQVGDHTETIDIEKLPVATTFPENIETHFRRCANGKGFVQPTVYVYQVPADMKGDINVTANLTVKEGVELPAELDVMGGASANVHIQFHYSRNTACTNIASKLAEINASNFYYKATK